MRTIRIYSRPGCHLCELLIEEIAALARGQAELEVVNIDTREDWLAQYDTRVPVVEVEGRFICQYALDRQALSRALDGEDRRIASGDSPPAG